MSTFQSQVRVTCPHCGQSMDIGVDWGGGTLQQYVEDCQVCCRPWDVTVRLGEDGTASADLAGPDD